MITNITYAVTDVFKHISNFETNSLIQPESISIMRMYMVKCNANENK